MKSHYTRSRGTPQVKVLYIVTAFPRDAEDVITPWMGETIRRLRDSGVAVDVLAPAYRGLASHTVNGVRVHRFRYAPRRWETLTHDQTAPDRIRERPLYLALVPGYLAAATLAAVRLARSGEYDVLHAFWPIPHGLVGLAAKRASGVPLVSTFFGVELTWLKSEFPALAPALRAVVRGSDAVTAISTYTAAAVAAAVPGANPAVIPFGATVEPVAQRAGMVAPAVSSPSRDEAKLKLLFVGRLVERKGVHVLLDALARNRFTSPWQLRVVGDGPERQSLEARAARLGISPSVVFEGFVPRQTLAERFAGCDIFILPAVTDAKGDTEGLGVVLLEAMSYGKPVVASAAGGIVDIVSDGETGLLVPPGDSDALASAIRRLAEDEAARRRMGSNARDRVDGHFSWPVIVERLVEVYRSVAGVRSSSTNTRSS